MSNPFPGMNPYLEGDLWSDLHNRLANSISEKIIPLITPKYHALVEPYITNSDAASMGLNIYYPDVAVVQDRVEDSVLIYENKLQVTAANLSIPIQTPIEVKIPVIEIREAKSKKLVTVIEVLSPANKNGLGFEKYQEKRLELIASNINLLEIDLLRRGKKIIAHTDTNNSDYLCALTRKKSNITDIWTIDLQATLPVLPIPLGDGDEDIPIDLQAVLDEIYQKIKYGSLIDFSKKVPPPRLSKEKKQWIQTLISKKINAK